MDPDPGTFSLKKRRFPQISDPFSNLGFEFRFESGFEKDPKQICKTSAILVLIKDNPIILLSGRSHMKKRHSVEGARMNEGYEI